MRRARGLNGGEAGPYMAVPGVLSPVHNEASWHKINVGHNALRLGKLRQLHAAIFCGDAAVGLAALLYSFNLSHGLFSKGWANTS